MNYFKSVLVGLAAVFVICVLIPSLPTIVLVLLAVIKHFSRGGGIAVGPIRWHAPSLTQWLFMFAVFGAGFLWELRRLAKGEIRPATNSTDRPIS